MMRGAGNDDAGETGHIARHSRGAGQDLFSIVSPKLFKASW
jgi:hypothetical protein